MDDFYSSFLVISSRDSQDQNAVQEANAYLCAVLEENPTQFLLNLIEIINLDTIPPNIRLNAIKSLTIPIQKQRSHLPEGTDLQAVLPPLFDTLHNLIPLEGDETSMKFSKSASDTFICFVNSLLMPDAIKIVNNLFERMQEGITPSYFKKLLFILSSISWHFFLPENIVQYAMHLINFFQTLQGDQPDYDECAHFFLLTLQNILQCFEFQEAGEEFTGEILRIVWEYAKDFPSETSLILTSVIRGVPNLFVNHPEVVESYMEALQSSLAMYPLLDIWNYLYYHKSCEFFLKSQWDNVLGYCVALIETDTSDEVILEDEEIGTSSKTICAKHIIEMILEMNAQECTPYMLQYIHEHIEEEGTPSKFLASIFSSTIAAKITDDVIYGEQTIELNPEERDQILFKMLEDESPRVLQQAVKEASKLINNKLLEPSEELLQYAFQLFSSDNNVVSEISTRLIGAIANSDLEGVREAVVGEMEEVIEQYEDPPKVAESLRTMTEIAQKMTPDSSAAMIERILTLSSTLLEEHFTDPTVSPCIGLLIQLILNAGQLAAPFLEPCVTFGAQLLERDFEDDGMALLSALLEIFGNASDDLVQIATDQVVMNFTAFTNELNLRALIQLAINTVQFIDNPEYLNNIIIGCIDYLDKPNNVIPSLTKKELCILLASINVTSPELISAHAEEILHINTVYVPFTNKRREWIIQLLINLASSLPDGCENTNLYSLLLIAIRSIVLYSDSVSNYSDVVFQLLELISVKTPASISQGYMPITPFVYSKLEKMLSPERVAVLHHLIPKPE